MTALLHYAESLTEKAGLVFESGEVFAKVLTRNDDSGRHGILIPSDAYSFFPTLEIPDPTINTTGAFSAFDVISRSWCSVGHKYYERYPERRITRLNGIFNDLDSSPRLFVALKVKHRDGSSGY
jgi:hypothetical protein